MTTEETAGVSSATNKKPAAQASVPESERRSEPNIQFHPASMLFPMLTQPELEDLAEDIRQHGLREPIWLHPDGTILDGRNRLAACRIAGIAPTSRTWDGDGSPVGFVISMNLRRRHLNESQRAMAAAKAKTLFEDEARERQANGTLASAEAKGRSADKAAEAFSVSGSSVERASMVLKRGVPEVIEAVEQGELPVASAIDLSDLPAGQQADLIAKGPQEVRRQVRQIRSDRRPMHEQKGKRTPLAQMKSSSKSATKKELLDTAEYCFEAVVRRFPKDPVAEPVRRILSKIQALRGERPHA